MEKGMDNRLIVFIMAAVVSIEAYEVVIQVKKSPNAIHVDVNFSLKNFKRFYKCLSSSNAVECGAHSRHCAKAGEDFCVQGIRSLRTLSDGIDKSVFLCECAHTCEQLNCSRNKKSADLNVNSIQSITDTNSSCVTLMWAFNAGGIQYAPSDIKFCEPGCELEKGCLDNVPKSVPSDGTKLPSRTKNHHFSVIIGVIVKFIIVVTIFAIIGILAWKFGNGISFRFRNVYSVDSPESDRGVRAAMEHPAQAGVDQRESHAPLNYSRLEPSNERYADSTHGYSNVVNGACTGIDFNNWRDSNGYVILLDETSNQCNGLNEISAIYMNGGSPVGSSRLENQTFQTFETLCSSRNTLDEEQGDSEQDYAVLTDEPNTICEDTKHTECLTSERRFITFTSGSSLDGEQGDSAEAYAVLTDEPDTICEETNHTGYLDPDDLEYENASVCSAAKQVCYECVEMNRNSRSNIATEHYSSMFRCEDGYSRVNFP